MQGSDIVLNILFLNLQVMPSNLYSEDTTLDSVKAELSHHV